MESKTPVIAIIGNGNPRVLTCSKCIKDCHGRAIELETKLLESQAEIEALKSNSRGDLDLLAADTVKMNAMQDEIDLLKAEKKILENGADAIKSTLDAQIAEIERLKVWLNENHAMDAMTIRNHAKTIEKRDAEIERKDKLIEQMREALQSAVEDWAHKFNHDENPEHGGWAVQAGKILNELQNAALSAAERSG